MNRWIRLVLSTLLFFTTTPSALGQQVVVYYHNDALGSPVAATNEQGQVIWREGYKPYGERTFQPSAGKANTVWFTGKQEEAKVGLSYFGARWYHPTIGRFLIFDPAGADPSNIHSFNRYAYANNNPYKYVDPDGRNPALAAEAGWAAGVGLNTLVYHATGIALTTIVVDAAWNALHNESGAGTDAGSGEGKKDTLKPGPHAGDSIPARGPGRDFTPNERDKINEIGASTGCHTCGTTDAGTKSGNFVPDHQPPTALKPEGTPQNLYPQCIGCSRTQGGQVRGKQQGE